MLPADGYDIGKNILAAIEHGNAGGAATDIDHRRAELYLIGGRDIPAPRHAARQYIGQHSNGTARHSWRDCAKVGVAAVTRCKSALSSDPHHLAWIADIPRAVEIIRDRKTVQDLRVAGIHALPAFMENIGDVLVGHTIAGKPQLHDDMARTQSAIAAGKIHDHIFNRFARHLLCRMHGGKDGGLGFLHISNHTAFYAARKLVADADNGKVALRIGSCDKARDFAAADIKRGDRSAFVPLGNTARRCHGSKFKKFHDL